MATADSHGPSILFVLSFRQRDDLADLATGAGWQVVAARRAAGAEQRFLSSGAAVAVIDARGALKEGRAAASAIGGAIAANGGALLVLVSRGDTTAIGDFYDARALGKGRVAGFDADVLQLAPRDGLRFGYRIWSERRSGLVIALQTVDDEGRVVEQSAFSELQLDAPIKMNTLSQMMGNTTGYRVEKSELERTTAVAEGWSLKTTVPGFKPVSVYRRALDGDANPERTMQWTFTDGLASVSLFIEPYDAARQSREVSLALGATHTLTRKLVDRNGDWWLTAVGEVPAQTLESFAQNLVRLR